MEGYLTLTEMAHALGLKNGAGLRRQVLRGAIRAELVGKTYLVPVEEVERYRAVHLGQRGKRTPAPGRKASADEDT